MARSPGVKASRGELRGVCEGRKGRGGGSALLGRGEGDAHLTGWDAHLANDAPTCWVAIASLQKHSEPLPSSAPRVGAGAPRTAARGPGCRVLHPRERPPLRPPPSLPLYWSAFPGIGAHRATTPECPPRLPLPPPSLPASGSRRSISCSGAARESPHQLTALLGHSRSLPRCGRSSVDRHLVVVRDERRVSLATTSLVGSSPKGSCARTTDRIAGAIGSSFSSPQNLLRTPGPTDSSCNTRTGVCE